MNIMNKGLRCYIEAIHDIQSNSISKENERFIPNPNLKDKVSKEGNFHSFYGDTILFDLDPDVKAYCEDLRNELYKDNRMYYADSLDTSTFHMTLHDLSNSIKLELISDKLFYNELQVFSKREKIKNMNITSIKMETTCLFSMVNSSIAIGLIPVDEDNFNKLKCLYDVFDEIVPFEYGLLPHITLAYFSQGEISSEGKLKLINRLQELSCNKKSVVLNLNQLFYTKFIDMNQLFNIFKVIG